MIKQLNLALDDIWKKKGFILFILIETVIILLFFIFTFDQFRDAYLKKQVLNSLETQQLVYFYADRSKVTESKTINYKRVLEPILSQEAAYLAIPEQVQHHGQRSENVYVIIGAFDKIYDIDEVKDARVMCGPKVDWLKPHDSIELGSYRAKSYEVDGELTASGGFTIGEQTHLFEDSVLVFLSYEEYASISFPNDIQSYLIWSKPQTDELSQFLRYSEDSGITLIPKNLTTISRFNQIFLDDGLISAMYFLVSLIFVLISIFIQLYILVDSKRKEFSIHLILGARHHHLMLRLSIFIYTTLFLPLFVYNYILMPTMDEQPFSIGFVILFPILLTAILTLVLLRKADESKIYNYMRSE